MNSLCLVDVDDAHQVDVVAGLTVACMAVPQSMSYAAIAGLPTVSNIDASDLRSSALLISEGYAG